MTGPCQTLYVASHGDGALGGVVVFSIERTSGALRRVGEYWGMPAPRALALHPSERVLYAAGGDGDTGSVVALSVSGTSLRQLSIEASGGSIPCSVAVDPTGRYLLTANYGSGTLAVHSLAPDGSIALLSAVLHHEGSGPVADRQEASHLHQVCFDANGVNALVTDLGADAIYAYRLDAGTGRVDSAPVFRSSTPAGAGPRHLAFHGNDSVVVADELSSTVSWYRYHALSGELTWRASVAASHRSGGPTDLVNYPSQIAVHANGRLIIVANRGHDTIAAFAVSAGGLVPVAEVAAGARWPLHFITTRRRVYCACPDEDRITLLASDVGEAVFSEGRPVASVPSPMWILGATHAIYREGDT
jgi:6-phosphogluconolactonase